MELLEEKWEETKMEFEEDEQEEETVANVVNSSSLPWPCIGPNPSFLHSMALVMVVSRASSFNSSRYTCAKESITSMEKQEWSSTGYLIVSEILKSITSPSNS